MLYARWREVARDQARQTALWDGLAGRHYTFRELAEEAEHYSGSGEPVELARGRGPGFILSVLAAWRDQRILIPLEQDQSAPPIDTLPGDRIVHLKTTSATTGAPRMIAFTAEQLAADCDNIVSTMGLDASLPNVGAISLAHSYGFSNLVLPLLLKGIPLYLAASPLPESLRVAMEQVSAVALPAVPALWQTWSEAGIVTDRIRIAISAGAPLPLMLEQRVFAATGVKIHNFYGASECGGIAYDRASVPREDAALVGAPMDGVTVDLSGVGCVIVESAAVGRQYWPDSEPALADGVYHSGDLGELADGALYLRGRASDLINVAGRKVVPEEVERVLAMHPTVKDCLVFGIPAEGPRNEQVVGCVVCRGAVSGAELGEFLRAKLPSWQVPREWWFVDDLSVNRRGKRSRAHCRARYLSGLSGTP